MADEQGRWYVLRGKLPVGVPPMAMRLEARLADGQTVSMPAGIGRGGEHVSVVTGFAGPVTDWRVLLGEGGSHVVVGLALEPTGRLGALLRMLPGPRRRRASALASGTIGGVMLMGRRLLTGGAHEAMRAVASRYQRAIAVATAVPPEDAPGTTAWVPVHQLAAASDEFGVEWLQASGDDPQMVLCHDGEPIELPGGWYELTLQVAVDSGTLVAPVLYPDYGTGMDEDNAIRLPEPDGQGRLHLLVMLKSSVAALRLDPSVRPLRFRILASELQRRGRIGALWLMLDRLRQSDGSRDWPVVASAVATFVRDAFRLGLSAAAARLHAGADGAADTGGDYAQWVRRYDTLLPTDIKLMSARVAALAGKPLVSILVPVYQTPPEWLRRCLDSVLAQAYENWELCIVDDASPSPAVGRLLARYAQKDARIRVMRRDTNGHISAASNDALAMARGQYVALLDHDDELRPHALLEMMELLERNPRIGLAYSDEDKIDEHGRRFQPNFKPDWNPDLLLSQNYVCHFTVVRTDLARKAGGFRQGYEGSQDHDLILRCSEYLEPDQIGHVPRVLYHWRAIGGSTALERSAKDYASAAGARAVADHLSRVAPGATAEELAHGHYRVRWPLPAHAPRVSIIIPTRDRLELLRSCVQSVLEFTTYPDYEILVVDNRSEEPETLAWLEQVQSDPRVRVLLHDAPFNYSEINNAAVNQASGEVVCLLNNDIEVVTPGWLEELVGQAIRPGIGAVGAKLHYPDNTIQHAGVILGLGGVANHVYTGLPAATAGHGARALVAQNISAVTGACLVVRKPVYQEVGGLEERLQVAFNDIDFCLRLGEAGYRNVWTPFAVLVHHESASRGRDEFGERRTRFLGEVEYMERRWGKWLASDPAYNPNLSLDDLASGLAFPPRTGYKRTGVVGVPANGI